ncbi:MAG: methionine synthase, partial [Candidatus Thorarchaeota archaeon]
MIETNTNRIKKPRAKKILMACIGQCVHVTGTYNFMNIATQLGFECLFLGPAIPNSVIINKIQVLKPDILGLSYRLTPSTVIPILKNFKDKYDKSEYKPQQLFFAGTPDVVKIAKEFGIFHEYFIGGESKHKIISILRKDKATSRESVKNPEELVSRIKWKKPYPIIRAHFGLPRMEETLKGIKKIADSEVLDVISIAPDQNTQANYFHPEDQVEYLSGAGGVPIRT